MPNGMLPTHLTLYNIRDAKENFVFMSSVNFSLTEAEGETNKSQLQITPKRTWFDLSFLRTQLLR